MQLDTKLLVIKPIAQLPSEQANAFIEQLVSPQERFAESYYYFRRHILQLSNEQAIEGTIQQLEDTANTLLNATTDPNMYTFGLNSDKYIPIGIFTLCPLDEHHKGRRIAETLKENGYDEVYTGSLGLLHNFTVLNGYRSLRMLKASFVFIALTALENRYQHLFFYLADHRLKGIYTRFGLTFPPDLLYPDLPYIIGLYSLGPDNVKTVFRTMASMQLSFPFATANKTA